MNWTTLYETPHTMESTHDPIVHVEGRTISPASPAFIVAEAACNHMCRMDYALQLIDSAAAAGVDAVKFQTYTAEKLTSRTAAGYGNIGSISQYEYYKQFDRFGRQEYEELFEYARAKGVVPFSTPFDPDNAQMLNSVDAPLFKIASCDLLYADLLREVACFGKPIIVSTGGSTLDEIRWALDLLGAAGANQVAILACTLAYPTKAEDANYRRIATLQREFPGYVVGISDHVVEHAISGAVCLALGARIFEKHFALAQDMGGGSAISLTPDGMAEYVRSIRTAETLLGSAEVKVYAAEESTRRSARRSLVAATALAAGTVLSREMLGVKRPGTGIGPDRIDEVVGRRLRQALDAEIQLEWSHLES